MTRGRKKEELDDDEEEQLLEFQSTKPPGFQFRLNYIFSYEAFSTKVYPKAIT